MAPEQELPIRQGADALRRAAATMICFLIFASATQPNAPLICLSLKYHSDINMAHRLQSAKSGPQYGAVQIPAATPTKSPPPKSSGRPPPPKASGKPPPPKASEKLPPPKAAAHPPPPKAAAHPPPPKERAQRTSDACWPSGHMWLPRSRNGHLQRRLQRGLCAASAAVIAATAAASSADRHAHVGADAGSAIPRRQLSCRRQTHQRHRRHPCHSRRHRLQPAQRWIPSSCVSWEAASAFCLARMAMATRVCSALRRAAMCAPQTSAARSSTPTATCATRTPTAAATGSASLPSAVPTHRLLCR